MLLKFKKIVILLVTMYFFLGCINKTESVNIESKLCHGFSGKELFNSIDILNDTAYFMGGALDLDQKDAIIYLSLDEGVNWTPVFQGRGTVQQIVCKEGYVFASVASFDVVDKPKAKLMVSSDFGRDWNNIEYNGDYIRNITIVNRMHFILCVSRSDNQFVIETKDGGQTWDDITYFNKVKLIYCKSFMLNKTKLLGVYRSAFNKDSIHVFSLDLVNYEFENFIPPIGYTVKIEINKESTPILVAEKANKVSTFLFEELTKNSKTNSCVIPENNDFIDLIFTNQDTLLLLNNTKTYTNFNDLNLFLWKANGKLEKIPGTSSKIFAPYIVKNGCLIAYLGNSELIKAGSR